MADRKQDLQRQITQKEKELAKREKEKRQAGPELQGVYKGRISSLTTTITLLKIQLRSLSNDR